jgi:hypothetical protein
VNDYKMAAQLEVERLAEDEMGVDYFSLSQNSQIKLYQRAETEIADRMAARCDYMRERAKEGV